MFMSEPVITSSDNGIPSDQYKRAVLQPPPLALWWISYGSYHHGMHISPVHPGDVMSVSSRSSRRSIAEYDIWRRWEDCLWFQDTLEQEYSRAAREKKTRLQQGKGPDPKSVAKDIHGYLPRLTKKGTIFRASQATIEIRQKELRALIETLFSDDMPALIQEIRASTIVTDFFGLWRRDYDNMDRPLKGIRSSVSSSNSSSSDTTTPASLPNSPARRPSRSSTETRYPQSSKRSSMVSIDTISEASTTSPVRPRRRPVSSSSSQSDSSSTHSDGSSDSASSTALTTPAIAEEVPYVFGHNPQSGDRPNSMLEILPEERDMLAKSQDFPSASFVGPGLRTWSEEPTALVERNVRESWQTTDSLDATASEIMDGLNLSLPHPIKDNKYRESLASISTFMTTDSADAVIPAALHIYSDCDNDTDSMLHRQSILDSSSILNAFPPRQSPRNTHRAISDSPSAPVSPITPDFGQTSFHRPPSPTSTISTAYTFSTVTSSVSPGSISIKAAHNSAIILLRVSREMSLTEVRQRIYNKFVGQEGIPLANDFAIAFAHPTPKSPAN
ncbi:hypothetical protein BJ912DRAFT_998807 [Pholiota molesta]|nr:hypothetical protein BJ912DRAFT_998807 [Pholiota molesta]